MLVRFWTFSSNRLITVLHLTWLQQVHLDVLQVSVGLKLMVLLCFCPNVPKSANVSLRSVTSWKHDLVCFRSSTRVGLRLAIFDHHYWQFPALCTDYYLEISAIILTRLHIWSSGKKSPRTEYQNHFLGLTMFSQWRNLLWCAGFAPGLASRVKIVKETSV